MASWSELKAEARTLAHATFGLSGQYLPPSGAPVTVTVRLHSRVEVFGDLDREGYAQQAEDVSRMVFLLSEVTPVRGARVTLEDGRAFVVHYVLPVVGVVDQGTLVKRVRA
jgi:hypothetical protein